MLFINQQSPIPISVQLLENFKKLILTGVLKKDEQLPSVRVVAKDLMINPNTVHKVYQELLSLDIVYSIPQKGLYVNEIPKKLYEDYISSLKHDFRLAYKNLTDMSLTKEEIFKLLD